MLIISYTLTIVNSAYDDWSAYYEALPERARLKDMISYGTFHLVTHLKLVYKFWDICRLISLYVSIIRVYNLTYTGIIIGWT